MEYSDIVKIFDRFDENNTEEIKNWRDKCNSTLLHVAAYYNDERMVRIALRCGCNVNSKNAHDLYPLGLVKNTHPNIVKILIEAGANVNVTDKRNRTPLFNAVEIKNAELVTLILNAGLNRIEIAENNQAALELAVKMGLFDIVKLIFDMNIYFKNYTNNLFSIATNIKNESMFSLLLDNSTDIYYVNSDKMTLLHFAVLLPSPAMTRRLLIEGIPVNQQNTLGFSALHEAAFTHNFNQVQTLIEFRADVNLQSHHGSTPLHRTFDYQPQLEESAIMSYNIEAFEIAELLLKNGADCNVRNRDGFTPFLCILNTHTDIKLINLFQNFGANIKAVTSRGENAAHLATSCINMDIIKFFLDNGFDIQDRTNDGSSLLHYAAIAGNVEICKLLVELGLSVNVKRSNDKTPLIDATLYVNTNVVEFLLEAGADIDCRCDKGQSFIDMQIYRSGNIKRIIVRHVAKLKYCNFKIQEDHLRAIKSDKFMQIHYEQCVRELDQMKEVKVYNDITLLDLLIENNKMISHYVRNPEFINSIKSAKFERDKFPIYFPKVEDRINKAMKYQEKSEIIVKYIGHIFGYNPFHLVVEEIVKHITI